MKIEKIKPIKPINNKTKKTKEKPQPKKKKEKKKKNSDELFVGFGLTTEQICDNMLKEAKLYELENPYFDYRNDYERGEIIYYVYRNRITKTASLKELKVSTVYPRAVVGYQDKGEAICIDYTDKDYIFETPKEAEKCLKSVQKKGNYE